MEETPSVDESSVQSGPSSVSLSPLEIASGIITGEWSDEQSHGAEMTPRVREALTAAVIPALERPPSLVAFSGGRDSSAMLALATSVARDHGLPLPIPASNRFPGAAATDEAEWQESVIRHLELDDWHRPEWSDELELLGPYATRAIRKHGLLWPANSHFIVPLLELARGGSLLTGMGGDELFGWWPWARPVSVMFGRERAEARDIPRIAFALAPNFAKRSVLRRRADVGLRWLADHARSQVLDSMITEDASMPVWWNSRTAWLGRRRYLHVSSRSTEVLAADSDTLIVHPMIEPEVLAAIGEHGGRAGFRDRTEAMTAFFGDLLPDAVLKRESKVGFDDIFWHRRTRSFIREWDGSGVDTDLVQPELLAQTWRNDSPDSRSALLLQAVWLGARQ